MAQDATEQSTENNDDPQTPPEPATPPQAPARDAAPAGTDTPPWERDGEQFDPAKAWNLIRHLREDNTKLKATNESNAARLREIEDAKLSEQEKLQRDLKETREQLASVNTAKAWAEARAKYPQLTDEDFDLIGAGTPEEITAKAAKLAARIDAQAAPDARDTNPALRAHPTGGTDPTSEPSRDWLRDAMTDKQGDDKTMADNYNSSIGRAANKRTGPGPITNNGTITRMPSRGA